MIFITHVGVETARQYRHKDLNDVRLGEGPNCCERIFVPGLESREGSCKLQRWWLFVTWAFIQAMTLYTTM